MTEDGRDSFELLLLNMLLRDDSPSETNKSCCKRSERSGVRVLRRYSVESGRWKKTDTTLRVIESPIRKSSLLLSEAISAGG